MDDSQKIDLLFQASDEVRSIREEAEKRVAGVYSQLLLDLQEEAGMSQEEAMYELYMLGVRAEALSLEA